MQKIQRLFPFQTSGRIHQLFKFTMVLLRAYDKNHLGSGF